MSTASSGYTTANTAPFTFDLASKKSYGARFLLSIAVVAVGIALAVWALASAQHGFSSGEFGFMTVFP
jgi:ABC-type dipeptide/oligopeptide/nickel transport system permease subunit